MDSHSETQATIRHKTTNDHQRQEAQRQPRQFQGQPCNQWRPVHSGCTLTAPAVFHNPGVLGRRPKNKGLVRLAGCRIRQWLRLSWLLDKAGLGGFRGLQTAEVSAGVACGCSAHTGMLRARMVRRALRAVLEWKKASAQVQRSRFRYNSMALGFHRTALHRRLFDYLYPPQQNRVSTMSHGANQRVLPLLLAVPPTSSTANCPKPRRAIAITMHVPIML